MTIDGSHRRAAPSVPRDPLLSVVMPVYNERNTIEEIIRRVLAVPGFVNCTGRLPSGVRLFPFTRCLQGVCECWLRQCFLSHRTEWL